MHTSSTQLSSKDIATYLQDHPNFFCDHKELLTQLYIPHSNPAGHISLLEYQVVSLRESRDVLATQYKKLIHVIQANEQTKIRFIAVLDAMLQTKNASSLLDSIKSVWKETFDKLDDIQVLLCKNTYESFFSNEKYTKEHIIALSSANLPVEIANALRTKQHQIGKKPSKELQSYFGNSKIQSFLFLPDITRKAGLLLGSTTKGRFINGLNADLAKAITRIFLQRLDDLLQVEQNTHTMHKKVTHNNQPTNQPSQYNNDCDTVNISTTQKSATTHQSTIPNNISTHTPQSTS